MALAGDLIVGAATSRNVVQYDEGTGDIVGTFIESIAGPHSMTFGPDGNIYIVAALGNQIRRYKPDSGELIDIFISSGLNTPTDAKFGPDGNLYVLNFSTSNVTRFDGETGAFIDIFIQTGNGGLQRPENLAFGPDGNLYITDARTRAVHRFDAETGFFIDNFVGDNASTPDNDESGGLNGGQELIFRNSDRLLYVANVGGHNILRFDAFTGEFVDVFVTSRSGGLSTPHDIIFGADENLYVASQDSDEVLRYDGETGEFIDAFVSAGSGGIDGTWSMLFLPDEDSSLKISLAIIFIEPTLTTHKINIDLFSKKSFDISERRANFVFSIGIG
jgi:DNA-binding beta-propeller fold protein YncE